MKRLRRLVTGNIIIVVLSMLSTGVFASGAKDVDVYGTRYLEEENITVLRKKISVSNVVKELDTKEIEKNKGFQEEPNGAFVTKIPTVLTLKGNETMVFGASKINDNKTDYDHELNNDVVLSGKVEVMVEDLAHPDGYKYVTVDVNDFNSDNFDMERCDIHNYKLGYNITIKEPGEYEILHGDANDSAFTTVYLKVEGNDSGEKGDIKLSARPTKSKVLVNGKDSEFDAYNINDNNYFKLRDIAKVVSGTTKQFEVQWNSEKQAIDLISNQIYTEVGGEMLKGDGLPKTPIVNKSKIYRDGHEIDLQAFTINGNNYFKLRDLGEAFNIGIEWDGVRNTVVIDTSKDY